MIRTLKERFDEKWRIAENGCWEWTAGLTVDGYGRMWGLQGMELSHRVAFELYKGEIHEGLCVLHSCDNPKCVNPEHLSTGTHLDNMMDMISKNRGVYNHGEKTHLSKLCDADVLEIRKMTGTNTRIAELFGVTNSTISKVRLRRTWKHI